MNPVLSPRGNRGDLYVDPPELEPVEQKRASNEKTAVAEVAKPIFDPPIPRALIPLLYRKDMRVYVSLTRLKTFSTVTEVAEHTLNTREGNDIPFSHAAPAIPIAGGEEVFIYPPKGAEYFGKMVSMPDREHFIISFKDKEIAIPRIRIWPLETINPAAHKKRLMEAVKGIKE